MSIFGSSVSNLPPPRSDEEMGLIGDRRRSESLQVEVTDPTPMGTCDCLSRSTQHLVGGFHLSMQPIDTPCRLCPDVVGTVSDRMNLITMKTLLIIIVACVCFFDVGFVLNSAYECYVKQPFFQVVVYVVCVVHLAAVPFVLYWVFLIYKASSEDEINAALQHEQHGAMAFIFAVHAIDNFIMIFIRGAFLHNDLDYAPETQYVFNIVATFSALYIFSCLRRCLMIEAILRISSYASEVVSVFTHLSQIMLMMVLCFLYYEYFGNHVTKALTTAIILICVIIVARHAVPAWFNTSWKMFKWNGPVICVFVVATYVFIYELTIGIMVKQLS